ncbi:hypothetical protein PG984_007565 [Apiospora sp. TS-2023a]
MSCRNRLPALPEELLVMIVRHLARTRDVNTVSRLNRRFYRVSNNLIVDRAVNDNLLGCYFYSIPSDPFVEALQYDSWVMIRILMGIPRGVDPTEVVKTYLLAALLHDAPHVASDLLEKGAKLFHQMMVGPPVLGHQQIVPGCFMAIGEVERYRDMKPLLRALENPRERTERNLRGVTKHTLNAALRMACRYQWPRTVSYLLKYGADPNAIGRNGTAAIHHFALELNRVAIAQRNVPLSGRDRPSSAPSFPILSMLQTTHLFVKVRFACDTVTEFQVVFSSGELVPLPTTPLVGSEGGSQQLR